MNGRPYLIDTIGELPGTPSAQAPASAPVVVAIVQPLSALQIAGIASTGAVLGVLGMYAWERWRK